MSSTSRNADALVVFGITGDLARKMTLRSLYRLERRRPARLPGDRRRAQRLVGAAAARARPQVDPGDRREDLTSACSRASPAGCRTSAATSATPETYERVAQALGDAKYPAFYLEIPPSLFATVVGGLSKRRAALAAASASWSRSRSGTICARRARCPRDLHQLPRRVPAVPDRSLPGQDGPRGVRLPAVRQHDARAGLEPQLHRLGPDHDGRGVRRRGPRAASTTRSARCATWWSTT